MNTLTPFGKDVRIRLLEKNIKQYELAQMIGTTNPSLSRILYGTRPGKKVISNIIEILELDARKYVAQGDGI